MILFDKVIGHKQTIENLRHALKSGARAQAFLFAGPAGVGKRLVALGWAQGLLCENEKQRPCGKCSSCLRVEKLSHPDLMVVAPGEGASTLKIEQVRDIQNFVSLKAFEGQSKVVIINEAQTMTAQAFNALLKTLEEPPEGCHFVLITSNKASVLPTIQSRCQKILFGSLTEAELKKILPETDDWVLELAQGRVDLAGKFSDDHYKKLRAGALKILRDIAIARLFEGFTSLEDVTEDRDTSLFTLQCWSQWVKAAAAMKLSARVPVSKDEKATIDSLAQALTVPQLLTMSQKILALEHDIQANINKSLAFEKFWIDVHCMTQQKGSA